MRIFSLLATVLFMSLQLNALADDFTLHLRSQRENERSTVSKTWAASETAVIVCDVWDYHHCVNAVHRLEEFAPRLNELLGRARQSGATIIHSPSDCMPSYKDHPARKRAIATSQPTSLPKDIALWCSRIPAEATADYPIDQSDGGEDNDPKAHTEWAAKLKAIGRNPNMPWQSQSPLIQIDGDRDYISDRGEEVWSILQARGIKHVLLTGVHTNMCVLGRPFGLRQMARNQMDVALVRDMTDCMYNPQRAPFVNHFSGNDLIVSYVERYICPTVTSDQILGGKPFRSRTDTREQADLFTGNLNTAENITLSEKQWSTVSFPRLFRDQKITVSQGPVWYRCAIVVRESWLTPEGLLLQMSLPRDQVAIKAWINGRALDMKQQSLGTVRALVDPTMLTVGEANLLVISTENYDEFSDISIVGKGSTLSLQGRWQIRCGNDPTWSNMPLPAKFGASADIVFDPDLKTE